MSELKQVMVYGHMHYEGCPRTWGPPADHCGCDYIQAKDEITDLRRQLDEAHMKLGKKETERRALQSQLEQVTREREEMVRSANISRRVVVALASDLRDALKPILAKWIGYYYRPDVEGHEELKTKAQEALARANEILPRGEMPK